MYVHGTASRAFCTVDCVNGRLTQVFRRYTSMHAQRLVAFSLCSRPPGAIQVYIAFGVFFRLISAMSSEGLHYNWGEHGGVVLDFSCVFRPKKTRMTAHPNKMPGESAGTVCMPDCFSPVRFVPVAVFSESGVLSVLHASF